MVYPVWISFILVILYVNQGSCDDEKYRAGFSAGVESCNDFTNDNFDADNMNLAPMDSDDEDGAGAMCIEGSLELHKAIDEGVMLNIDIEKETAAGSEPMFSASMDMCECIKDEDAPWKPIFAAMGIESCPVETGTYSVSNMTLDLSFAKDIINHNYVGEYMCKVTLADTQRNLISCHNLGICIVEE